MAAQIKSDNTNLTLNADGSNDIKFQSNGVEKASISSAGAFTSTTIDATVLTGALPAISGASLTNVPAANITGTLPAIDGSNLTGVSGGKILQVASVEDSTRESFSTSADYYPISVAFTKISATSKIIVIASVIGHAGSAGLCGTGLKLDSTKKYVGGYSYSTNGVIYSGMADFGVVATGSHTAYWGWTTANGTSTKPFSTLNPNSSEESRSQQKVSTILVYEVEA